MRKFLPGLQGSKVTQIDDSLIPSKHYDQWVQDLSLCCKNFLFNIKKKKKKKTQDVCINEPSMKGKREDIGFNLNHTI